MYVTTVCEIFVWFNNNILVDEFLVGELNSFTFILMAEILVLVLQYYVVMLSMIIVLYFSIHITGSSPGTFYLII